MIENLKKSVQIILFLLTIILLISNITKALENNVSTKKYNEEKILNTNNDLTAKLDNIKNEFEQTLKNFKSQKFLTSNSFKDYILYLSNKHNLFIIEITEEITSSFDSIKITKFNMTFLGNFLSIKGFIKDLSENIQIVENTLFFEINEKNSHITFEVCYE